LILPGEQQGSGASVKNTLSRHKAIIKPFKPHDANAAKEATVTIWNMRKGTVSTKFTRGPEGERGCRSVTPKSIGGMTVKNGWSERPP